MLAATARNNALHDRPVEMKVLLVYVPVQHAWLWSAGRACVRVCMRRMNRFCATAAAFRRAGKSIY